MAQIHLLSSETINRIAAGEVVERPSGVVKELVENAIDAGADAITIEIRGGGIDLIRVTDNGCGIEPDQVRAAFRRHATSKIEDAEDLNRLSSLGFRGEALSSIAAVAEVEMITCTRGALVGTRVQVTPPSLPAGSSAGRSPTPSVSVPQAEQISRAGDAADGEELPMVITQIGAPEGTSVIVRNLFRSVPVRRKFLKSPQTEAGAVTDLVSSFALSHPDISFHYRKDGQEKLHTTGSGDIRELIYRIYGRETVRSVIPFENTDPENDLRVSGYLGRPELSRSTRNFEFFYVNGRILRSDVLSRGLEEGYRTDLMQHRFPFAMVWLTIPAGEIDVNVHPSKMEVRFTNARCVYDLLNESVHAALHREELIPHETPAGRAEEAAAARREQEAMAAAQSRQPHEEPFERGGKVPSRVAPAPVNQAGDAGIFGKAQDGSGTEDGGLRSSSPSSAPARVCEEGRQYDGTGRSLQESPAVYEKPAPVHSGASGGNPAAAGAGQTPLPSSHNEEEEEDFTFLDKTVRYTQQTLFAPKKDLPDENNAEGEEDRGGALPGSYSEDPHLLTSDNARSFRYVGQIFGTYWIIEFQDKMLMIDQHAAHEKVNFERLMRRLAKEQQEPAPSQMLSPPVIINLTGREEAAYEQYEAYFHRMGYEIEPFGENSHAIRSVPMELYANEPDALLRQTLDEILDSKLSGTPSAILYKIASMSCKASIKGNTVISQREAEDLIEELLQCDNPYHCPHGRPTMIVMPQSEIDRKFRRIV